MKIEVDSVVRERKLVAVLNVVGSGIFFPTEDGRTILVGSIGHAAISPYSLKAQLTVASARKGIYEGDSITLTF